MENQTHQPAVQQAEQAQDDEINLLDLLLVLAKNKAMIVGVTFAAALIAVGVSLLKPNIYTATTKILPPQGQSSAGALLSQLGGLAGMAGGSLGIKNPNDLYVSILQSRAITEKIVKKFNLMTVYEQKDMTGTLQALSGSLKVTSGKDGIIAIEVDDHDPKRAADMANAFVEELDKLMQTFALTDASQKRVFFDRQLRQAKDKLTDAEIDLDKTPNTSLHYLDAVRNMRYQEAIWEILAKQFEMAKMDEAKDFPLLQVLDKAVPPEKKSKPKRALTVILATLMALFVAMIWAFVREAMRRAREQPEQAERLAELRGALGLKR